MTLQDIRMGGWMTDVMNNKDSVVLLYYYPKPGSCQNAIVLSGRDYD